MLSIEKLKIIEHFSHKILRGIHVRKFQKCFYQIESRLNCDKFVRLFLGWYIIQLLTSTTKHRSPSLIVITFCLGQFEHNYLQPSW